MCEQTEVNYLDGDVVWVKLGNCWWPGEVVGPEKLPPDVLPSFRKPPIAVVKFYQEDTYEYVKNLNCIYKYNCSRKDEFINKGLYMYRTKHGHMDKFPEDVIRAETAVGGDIKILTQDKYQEVKKESYAGLFGGPTKKTPASIKKGNNGRGRNSDTYESSPLKKLQNKTNYKVHILVQPPKSQAETSENVASPCTSRAGSEPSETLPEKDEKLQPEIKLNTPVTSTPGIYACHACQFSTTRLNVLIMHNKTHSSTFTPYTPSPVKKKTVTKTPKVTPGITKTPKVRKPKQEKGANPLKKQSRKRVALDASVNDTKKPKTDEEIKSSLLADWDDADEDSNDESSVTVMAGSPEIPVASQSPAVPTPAELPTPQATIETSPKSEKKQEEPSIVDETESANDAKYEFREDEDWPEADIGRKIPRVKNPSKRRDDSKSIDEDEMAREVAELLNKTTLPELPSAPEPLKVEANFPEPSIVKSPDKKLDVLPNKNRIIENINVTDTPPTKTIFKTKTFFRSRHSRSQDAIGKYIAEQLNAAERIDLSESDLNGAESVPSPEPRISPPIEHVKVARLAPKIQLKKMKAEAAQLLEKEKRNSKKNIDEFSFSLLSNSESFFNTQEERDKTVKPPFYDHLKTDNSQTLSVKNIEEDTINDQSDKRNETHNNLLMTKDDVSVSNKQREAELETNKSMLPNTTVQTYESYMSESTASAVDALLSVSRETDRVTKVISDDPPEDLFEDDNKDNLNEKKMLNNVNGFSIDTYEESQLNIDNEKDSERVQEEKVISHDDKVNVVCKLKDDIPIENIQVYAEDHQTTLKCSINDVDPSNSVIKETSPHLETKQNTQVSYEKTQDVPENTGEISEAKDANSQDLDVVCENTDVICESTDMVCEDTEVIYDNADIISENTVEISESTVEISENTMGIPENIVEISENTVEISENTVEISENTIEMSEMVQDIFENADGGSKKTQISQNTDVMSENIPIIVEHSTLNAKDLPSNSENISAINDDTHILISENIPTESDLQVAEALINLPTTSIHNKIPIKTQDDKVIQTVESNYAVTNKLDDKSPPHIEVDNIDLKNSSSNSNVLITPKTKSLNARFETEQEKSENLNAAQSLVQMSESIDHKHNLSELNLIADDRIDTITSVDDNEVTSTSSVVGHNVTLSTSERNISSPAQGKSMSLETNPSKLLKILEEPCAPKIPTIKKTISKPVIVTGKEKILNFDGIQPTLKNKSTKQKIIIRRTTPTKNLLNNITEGTTSEKIILSPSQKSNPEGSSVQTYTIKTTPEVSSDNNTIIIQPKIRKISKPVSKLQKIKPSLVTSVESRPTREKPCTDTIFDINSMPIVLSDDILTPESIEKMPFVMSDGNFITNTSTPPKLIKQKQTVLNNEKIPNMSAQNKTEVKTVLLNPNEVNKVTTPNILSKSSKLRGTNKPLIVIDKNTGKQKLIMTKSEQPTKEIKQSPNVPSVTQTGKAEKFIILPTQHSPRPGRTQKIVIDPQTGKAHMLIGKGPEMTTNSVASDNKPVSAKLIPSASDASTPGNTVMIITNAQGGQSRIVLTPEHEKILFPNKQQHNILQLKPTNHRPATSNGAPPKPTVSSVPSMKAQTRIVQKQKGAIITSKGQLIVGGRIHTATTTQSIAPLPEIRPAPKRIVASEPKKLVQVIQKNATEPLIFLQQKNGAVMQLTVAQFEHLQRTGQIIQKPSQEKLVVQKSITIPATESVTPIIQKQRIRKQVTESSTPAKKVKHEIAIAPALSPANQIPALTPLTNTLGATTVVPSASTISSPATSFSDLDNFEELLPSTAIARQPDPTPQPPPPAPVADGQLLAIPGENFGGPPGSFYLCVKESGTLTPIDNRPLVLENNQLVPMAETIPVLTPQPERRDILEAALANSDVFHAEPSRDDAPDFRDLNANVSVHCRVSETSTTLNQPIMTPVEVPSKVDSEPTTVPSNLEDGLAVIGVTPQTVPTSLELPITVTDPRIAPKTTDPLSNNNYGSALLPSPNTEMTFVTTDETNVSIVGPISMPLLTEEDSVGKSMPILTDDVTERTVSSVESAIGSPASIDIRESETEEGIHWSRRFLTPCSDTSETSAEIPLQPVMQLSANDISQSS